MDKVRLGIIGGGRIADLNILGYLDHPQCKVAAVCDLSEEVARKRKEEWGAEWCCTDYKKLLTSPEIDAVEILTPYDLHAPMVLEAARHGKHVSVQKPMCQTLTEADAMIRACREAGVKFKVFENFIFYPPYRKAKELLDAGEIGEPLSINLKMNGGIGGWPVPLKNWMRTLNYEAKTTGGGTNLYDDGFHKLSLARHFFGEIEVVKAWTDFSLGVIDMPALVTWSYQDSSVLGVFEVTTSFAMELSGKYYAADERVEILGTKGYIWLTRCTAKLMEIPPLLLHRKGQTISFDDMRDDWGDSFHDCGWDFIDSILEERPPLLSGEQGRAVMQFWLAVKKSYEEKREVRREEITG